VLPEPPLRETLARRRISAGSGHARRLCRTKHGNDTDAYLIQERLSIIGTVSCCANGKSEGSSARSVDRLTTPIGLHVPGSVPRLDETIFSGDRRIAKNVGMVRRINSVQAARHHKPAARAAGAVVRCSRRSDAENAQGSGEGKRDESLVSNHDDLPFGCRGGCSAS
jgi:hypothetical protein